jgi:hypothetical protein
VNKVRGATTNSNGILTDVQVNDTLHITSPFSIPCGTQNDWIKKQKHQNQLTEKALR